jgi:uncharacterized membrane protein
MRIRRTVIAPVVLAIGMVGSLAIGPTMAVLSTAAPAAAPVAAGPTPTPDMGYHL